MSEIEAEIDDAVRAAGIEAGRWRKLPLEQAREICLAVRSRFVDGDPRAWWLTLKRPFESHSLPQGDGFRVIQTYVPVADERCLLIPDTDEADFPVYEVAVSDVSQVLSECQYFEYYLVGERLDWLVTETEHNAVIVVRPSSSDAREGQ